MDVREIPRIIFGEFAENIRPEKGGLLIGEVKGGEGAVLGLKEDQSNVHLIWWAHAEDIGELYRCVFEIGAGTRDAGAWAYGLGSRLQESAWFRVAPRNWTLSQATSVLAEILKRASELAISESIERGSFWQADRDPDWDYTKPPR